MLTEAHMSTNLPPELNRLIAQELALGHYRTEEELLTEAVQLLTPKIFSAPLDTADRIVYKRTHKTNDRLLAATQVTWPESVR